MKASIVAVGWEVLMGEVKNTNTDHISSKLRELGVETIFSAVVGDDLEEASKIISFCIENSDVVFTTGGLGPTPDDLTREAVAKSLGIGLAENNQAKQWIEGYFRKTGMSMPQINYVQATLPDGSEPVWNGLGTAPGVYLEKSGKKIILLPGPPREMVPMLEAILPRIASPTQKIYSRDFHVYGISEAAMAEKIAGLLARKEKPLVAPYASLGYIRLRVWGEYKNEEEFGSAILETEAELKNKLSTHLFSDTIEVELGKILAGKKLTISCAESCTGGLVAKTITDVPGSSGYFTGGCVSYSNQAKLNILGVKPETLEAHGTVSEQTAIEMAEGCARVFGTDCAISTTGIAGPGGGTPDKPVGLVWMGFVWPGESKTIKRVFGGSRDDVRTRMLMAALFELTKEIR